MMEFLLCMWGLIVATDASPMIMEHIPVNILSTVLSVVSLEVK